jgi:gas vesicle protein
MTGHESWGSGGLRVALGFLCGALVGVAAAALLTPRSGPEVRRRIARAAERSSGRAARLGAAAREAFNDALRP